MNLELNQYSKTLPDGKVITTKISFPVEEARVWKVSTENQNKCEIYLSAVGKWEEVEESYEIVKRMIEQAKEVQTLSTENLNESSISASSSSEDTDEPTVENIEI